MSKYNITLTYQPDAGATHQCAGWIARVQYGDHLFAGWAPTRKQSYDRAYRWVRRARVFKVRKEFSPKDFVGLPFRR